MTLTEQWKKGELENDWYYVRTTNGIEKWEYIKQSHGFGYYETEWVLEVLAPVPSYEEWKTVFNCANKYEVEYIECANDYENIKKENQQLKTQIAKLTEIVGVLPSNHSVGNLGYKIKNQRHEINNRLKEIDNLKELLKECLNEIHELAEIQDNRSVTIYNFLSAELITKIDEVLK